MLLGSITRKLNIKPRTTIPVSVKINQLPQSLTGLYTILAQTTDTNGIIAQSVTGPIIAPPFLSLFATLVPSQNSKTAAIIRLNNTGNTDDVTQITAKLGFSLDPAGAQPIGGTISVTTPTIRIPQDRSVTLHFSAWKAILKTLTPGVPYYLTATLTNNTGQSALAISPTSFTI
jgi:hypothetical protein